MRGDHLICIVSERTPADYLDGLREKGISYIVSGKEGIDLADGVEKLGEQFGIRTLLLEGGGHINGAFLRAGLIDEVSILLVPGIDGHSSVASVFDGVALALKQASTKDVLALIRSRAYHTIYAGFGFSPGRSASSSGRNGPAKRHSGPR